MDCSENHVFPLQPVAPGTFAAWIDCLRRLHAPCGLIHVGPAPVKAHAIYQGWGLASVDLVDANAAVIKTLHDLVGARPDWQVHAAVLAESVGPRPFYSATIASESSLLDAAELRHLWRNLMVHGVQIAEATTLDTLVLRRVNWLIVDCLPALRIMQGAVGHLMHADVVVARVVLDETSDVPSGCGATELVEWMGSHGYRQLVVDAERFPRIGRVAFVRDHKALLGRKAAACEIEQRRMMTVENARDVLERELAASRAALSDAHDRIVQLELEARAAAEHGATRQVEYENALSQGRLECDRLRQLMAATLEQAATEREQLVARIAALELAPAPPEQVLHDKLVRIEACVDLIQAVLSGEPTDNSSNAST